jgi:hypothetical protein
MASGPPTTPVSWPNSRLGIDRHRWWVTAPAQPNRARGLSRPPWPAGRRMRGLAAAWASRWRSGTLTTATPVRCFVVAGRRNRRCMRAGDVVRLDRMGPSVPVMPCWRVPAIRQRRPWRAGPSRYHDGGRAAMPDRTAANTGGTKQRSRTAVWPAGGWHLAHLQRTRGHGSGRGRAGSTAGKIGRVTAWGDRVDGAERLR